jgi:hypothetical protein
MPSTRSAKSGTRTKRGSTTSGRRTTSRRFTSKKKYGESASRSVKRALHQEKRGTLKSGSGDRVTSRKQAIAIGLSEARRKGAKVPTKTR